MRERAELLDREAAAGRDPRAIGRVFLVGFLPATEAPWALAGAFADIVGRYGELSFGEFVFLEPGEWGAFERVIGQAIASGTPG